MRRDRFLVIVATLSVSTITASTIKRRQFCPLPDQVCAVTDLINTPPPEDKVPPVYSTIEVPIPVPVPTPISISSSSTGKNASTTSSLNATIIHPSTNSTNSTTQILVNGTQSEPTIPPETIPQNDTAIRNELSAYYESDLHHSITCPPHVRPVIRAMIRDAALLAAAGAAAAKAGGFPFNFFFPASYNLTAQAIFTRAADALSNRGEPTLFSCHDWQDACSSRNVRAWAGKRKYHIPPTEEEAARGSTGRDQIVNVVTLCQKVIGWPFNNWPCSKPPVDYETPAHVVLHEILHFRNVTMGEQVGDDVYGLDACHALLVESGGGDADGTGVEAGGNGGGGQGPGQGGMRMRLPGPEKSADCLATFASYAWELGFGHDEGKNGWRGEPCADKWGPPLIYPARISMEPRG